MAYYIVLSIGLVVSLMFCIKRRKGFSVSNLMFKSVSITGAKGCTLCTPAPGKLTSNDLRIPARSSSGFFSGPL